MKRSRLAVVLGALLGIGLLPGSAGAEGDVPPAQDDPPGCTTAAAEDDDGCGAQGRDNFAQEPCQNTARPGSLACGIAAHRHAVDREPAMSS